MWTSFLRENNRWSLYHKVVRENDMGVIITACGWEYDSSLERTERENPPELLMCIDCKESTQPGQDTFRCTRRLQVYRPQDIHEDK